MKPGEKMPTGAAEPMKQKPAETTERGGERTMRYIGGAGTQKSMHPAKSQPNTMRHLK